MFIASALPVIALCPLYFLLLLCIHCTHFKCCYKMDLEGCVRNPCPENCTLLLCSMFLCSGESGTGTQHKNTRLRYSS